MSVLMVSYDLGVPETSDTYKRFIQAIKNLGTNWAKPLKSQFFITTDLSVPAVRDALLPLMDQNDRLLVIEVTRNWATRGVPSDVTEWLKLHL
jgi:hypothetical protein